MKYKILIFDLDDTLIDNRENVKAAFETMLKEEGISFNDDDFHRWYELDKRFWVDWQDSLIEVPDHLKHEIGKKSDAYLDWVRSRRVLRYFNGKVAQEKAIELNNVYMHALRNVVVPIDGAKDILRYLSNKYKIIVATNGPKIATQHKLEKIGTIQYTSEVLSADMFGYMKPKIEFFEAIEKRYDDYEKDDYLIIGDSLKSDVGFGMNTGIDSCWFNKGSVGLEESYKPTYVITKLIELRGLL